jgi:hypothetical protein
MNALAYFCGGVADGRGKFDNVDARSGSLTRRKASSGTRKASSTGWPKTPDLPTITIRAVAIFETTHISLLSYYTHRGRGAGREGLGKMKY